MGCYAHLFTSDSEKPDYTLSEPNICLCAKYIVPAFWPLMFRPDAYRNVMPIDRFEPAPDDTPGHFFIAELDRALALFQQRENLLFELIPTQWKRLSNHFVAHLKARPLKYVHLDVGELATMVDAKAYFEQFASTLDRLDCPPFIYPQGLLAKYRKARLDPAWEALLDFAGINNNKTDAIEYWELAGAGEAQPAPWDEP